MSTLIKRTQSIIWTKKSSAQIEEYKKNGFLFLPQVLSKRGLETLQNKAEQIKLLKRPGQIFERDGKSVRSQFNFHEALPELKKILKEESLLNHAQEILGESLYIYQSHVNYKEPQTGKEYAWHSDYTFWHWQDGMPQPRAVSIMILLTKHSEENGPLIVLKGSHEYYYQKSWQPSQKSAEEEIHHDSAEDYESNGLVLPEQLSTFSKNQYQTICGEPGDAFIMDANLWHFSAENNSQGPRRALFVVLNHVENALVQPFGGGPGRPEFITSREMSLL